MIVTYSVILLLTGDTENNEVEVLYEMKNNVYKVKLFPKRQIKLLLGVSVIVERLS